ncbi:MAG: substrate-binding domain-containing protein, partial [Myxococcota bacterium]
MRVVLLIPDRHVERGFYDNLSDIAVAAAESLGHELSVLSLTDVNHRRSWVEQLLAQGRRILTWDERPKHVVLPNYRGIAETLQPELKAVGVGTFVIAERLPRGIQGVPQLVPDDIEAGAVLCRALVDLGRASFGDGRLSLAVISGDQTGAGRDRNRGLQSVLKEEPGVEQVSFQYGVWSEALAQQQTERFLAKSPGIRLIWAASDTMAVGAAKGAIARGRQPGKDVFIGGVDLDYAGLEFLRQGLISVSVGGHLMDGARAMVALSDLEAGGSVTQEHLVSPWITVRSDRAGPFAEFIGERRWR